jgi:hypothetical protein
LRQQRQEPKERSLAAIQRESSPVRIVLSGLPTLSLNLKRVRTYAGRMFRWTGVSKTREYAALPLLALHKTDGDLGWVVDRICWAARTGRELYAYANILPRFPFEGFGQSLIIKLRPIRGKEHRERPNSAPYRSPNPQRITEALSSVTERR